MRARLSVVAAVFLLLVLGAVPARLASAAGPSAIEGNPFAGRELLTDKLCTQCHAIWGHGGILGPDLSTAVVGKNWLDLVGDFWNHTPRMIDAMTAKGKPWPTLDRDEMSDLLAYLYYLRLFDEPGDSTRGSIAFARMQCEACHRLGGEGAARAADLDRFSMYPSSIVLAQAMWNAGPAMQAYQLEHGRSIPLFTPKDMADIQAHIRARGWRTGRRVELLPLPDPEAGAAVFRKKRCHVCHTSDATQAPDLRASIADMTVSEIGGVLWNHSYAMQDRMKSSGIPFPSFRDNEMADLISYLHFLSFLNEKGDSQRGMKVLQAKGCTSCHGGDRPGAVDLAGSRSASDPVALSAAMWNHAPEMHDLMAERSVAWPKFDPGEMADLAAYLRSVSGSTAKDDP